ncbi:MAG TPA: sigma-70 family RNA polymerase sigma factor [Candidatus Udaeobacter sp.]|jgi:RNA polymerase sigma factor (TIGR02999 family)|nr:sigma-70 family RNA polymerase sigma factor [Candidatus Udaeobacter sp.]
MNGEPEGLDAAIKARAATEVSTPDVQKVSQLLEQWSHGDTGALQRLTPLVYDELRRLARQYMRGQSPDHTLQTTALVNEAYLRLAGQKRPSFANRSHFLAVAAKAMRQILVNHAKALETGKRGAGAGKVQLDEAAVVSPEQTSAILDVNEALERLAMLDSRKAHVVELKYFGGLKEDEIAEVLNISGVTVRRDWTFARAWLYNELQALA